MDVADASRWRARTWSGTAVRVSDVAHASNDDDDDDDARVTRDSTTTVRDVDACARDVDIVAPRWRSNVSSTTTNASARVVGACRVCLEDVDVDALRRGDALALGCACTGGYVHAAFACAGAYALAKASEVDSTTCELCLGDMRHLPGRAAVLSRRRLELERARARGDVAVDIDLVDDRDDVGEGANATARVGGWMTDAWCAPCALVRDACARACAHRAVLTSFAFFTAGIYVLVRPDRLT